MKSYRVVIALSTLLMMATIVGCSDDNPDPTPPDITVVPEDPIDYFPKDSVALNPQPMGKLVVCNFAAYRRRGGQ